MSKFSIKGAAMFVGMTAVSLAVLRLIDGFSGGMLSKFGAR